MKVNQKLRTTKNYLLNVIETSIFKKKPKNLFISTGYFGTLFASVIANEYFSDCENYILITIDRQQEDSNIEWAKKLNSHWEGIDTINHNNYYEKNIHDFQHKWKKKVFQNVFSNHVEMLDRVHYFFTGQNYHVYEEGVATYYGFLHHNNLSLYTNIYFSNEYFKSIDQKIIIIDFKKIVELLKSILNLYEIESVEKGNNILYIMPGLLQNETYSTYQTFHLQKIMDFKSQGYNVYIAPHPRVPFDLQNLNILNQLPLVDLFILKNIDEIKFIVGQYSSILTYCDRWYGVKVYILDEKIPNVYQQNLKCMQDTQLNASYIKM